MAGATGRRRAERARPRLPGSHRPHPATGRPLRRASAAAQRGGEGTRRPRGRAPQEDGGGMELRPGYKQTEVGVIPEEWETRPLLRAVHIATGQVDPRREPYKSMVLVAPD